MTLGSRVLAPPFDPIIQPCRAHLHRADLRDGDDNGETRDADSCGTTRHPIFSVDEQTNMVVHGVSTKSALFSQQTPDLTKRNRYWWPVIGCVLSTLLARSSHSDETRAHYNAFFSRCSVEQVVSAVSSRSFSRLSLPSRPAPEMLFPPSIGAILLQFSREPVQGFSTFLSLFYLYTQLV
jgi:hypothetical protein